MGDVIDSTLMHINDLPIPIPIESFHSRGQHLRKFIATKGKVCIRKSVQHPRDWFGTSIWPPFHSFGTPIWPL